MSLLSSDGGRNKKIAIIPLKNIILYSVSEEIFGYNSSPILDICTQYSSLLSNENNNLSLYSSYFPSLEELITIYKLKIFKLYFIGEIEDKRVVSFIEKAKDMNIIKICFDN